MNLGKGYIRHCGPTAAVNVIRTLEAYAEACADKADSKRPLPSADDKADSKRALSSSSGKTDNGNSSVRPGAADPQRALSREKKKTEALFLRCADIGQKTRIYWNKEFLGRFGGTSNPLTGIFLRRCMKAAGLTYLHPKVRFHVWITPDAVEDALRGGAIVFLQIYRHPKYKDHHMLCYGYRRKNGRRQFLLADGWTPGPVWVDEDGLGRGHYLTIQCG